MSEDSELIAAEGRSYELTIPSSDNSQLEAKLHIPPGEGPFPGILFSEGIAKSPLPLEDLFSNFMVKKGFAVLTPRYLGQQSDRLVFQDAEHIVSAYQFLENHPQVDSKRVGMIGLSYGGMISLIGAADERIADRIKSVVSISGPTDLEGIITYARGDPNANMNIKRIVYNTLTETVKERIKQKQVSNLDDTVECRDMYIISDLLKTKNTYDVIKYIDSLSQRARDEIELFSPAHHAEKIKAPVLLIHGRADKLVPYEQAETLHKNIQAAGGASELIGVDGLGHIILPRDTREFISFLRSSGSATLQYVKEFMRKH